MTPDAPLVSVVLIFFNAATFIEHAIESVVRQTYDYWQLLLVDDGSTDGSSVLAIKYAERLGSKIVYLEHEGHQNRGMSQARNFGTSQAKGEYVAFIDADDVWVPNKLERQVQILNAHPQAALVYGRDLYWYSWTAENAQDVRDHMPQLGVASGKLIEPPSLLPRFLLGKSATPTPTNVMVRRSSLERAGGFEESCGVYEDQAFYSKLLLREAVIALDECWSYYRQHPESSCAVDIETGQSEWSRQRFLNWLENYLREQQINDEQVWKAVRQAQWLLRHPFISRVVKRAQRRMDALIK